MKGRMLLSAAAAVLALAGCNKKTNGPEGSAGSNDTVIIAQTTPPAGGTWADVVNATSAGGVMMGNPKAPTRLIEIGSLSCPHCRAFEEEGAPTLVDKYVKTGKVSWEFMPYAIHGPIDMAANMIVRCNGLKTFFPLVQGLYNDQPVWMAKLEAVPQDKLNQMQNLPTNQVFVTFANLLGLQDWAAARGVPQAKSNQCLSDQKMIDREAEVVSNVNSAYPSFSGTPSFAINGKLLDNTFSWDKLQPQLDAAVK